MKTAIRCSKQSTIRFLDIRLALQSVAAFIIDVKYDLAVPLYRYSKYLNDRDYPLSTKVLSNYVMNSAELLEPLYNALKAGLVDDNSSNVIYADETP